MHLDAAGFLGSPAHAANLKLATPSNAERFVRTRELDSRERKPS
jgi:hypothetical protein